MNRLIILSCSFFLIAFAALANPVEQEWGVVSEKPRKADLRVKSGMWRKFFLDGLLVINEQSISFEPLEDLHIFKAFKVDKKDVVKLKRSNKRVLVVTRTSRFKFRLRG
jgi:hypothetical protein